MEYLFWILAGVCVAGAAAGSWLLVLVAGVAALCIRRSFALVALAVVLDGTYGIHEEAFLGGFFFTTTFVVALFGAAYIRKHLFALRR